MAKGLGHKSRVGGGRVGQTKGHLDKLVLAERGREVRSSPGLHAGQEQRGRLQRRQELTKHGCLRGATRENVKCNE